MLAETFEDAFSIKFDFVPGKRARNVAVRRCHLIMRINSHEDRRTDIDGGKYKQWVQAYTLSQGQGTGGFTATPGSGWVFAETIATGEQSELAKPYALERFTTGALIDEHGAAGVAH